MLMKYLMSARRDPVAHGGDRLGADRNPARDLRKVAAQYQSHDSGRGAADCAAYLRMLDQIDPSYRELKQQARPLLLRPLPLRERARRSINESRRGEGIFENYPAPFVLCCNNRAGPLPQGERAHQLATLADLRRPAPLSAHLGSAIVRHPERRDSARQAKTRRETSWTSLPIAPARHRRRAQHHAAPGTRQEAGAATQIRRHADRRRRRPSLRKRMHDDILPFIENDVIRQLALASRAKGRGSLVPTWRSASRHGRPHHALSAALVRKDREGWQDARRPARPSQDGPMSVDYSCLFPTLMLAIGLHPDSEMEVELCWAYNRWLTVKGDTRNPTAVSIRC